MSLRVHFNTANTETAISILNAIERSGCPILFKLLLLVNFQVTITFMKLLSGMPNKMDIPVSLHLDHGKTLEDVNGLWARIYLSND